MFKRKPLEKLVQDADGAHGLKRVLGAVNLVSPGIGCIVGAGIFVLTGQAAAQYAGPAIIFSGCVRFGVLGEMVSIGTLFAFLIVCIGIQVLRRTHPEFPRAFKTPWVPFVPIAGALLCVVQMIALPLATWLRLVVWMAIGLIIYFTYSHRHSRLRHNVEPKM